MVKVPIGPVAPPPVIVSIVPINPPASVTVKGPTLYPVPGTNAFVVGIGTVI